MKLRGICNLISHFFLWVWRVWLKWCTRLDGCGLKTILVVLTKVHSLPISDIYKSHSFLWLTMKMEAYCEHVKQNRLLKYIIAMIWWLSGEKSKYLIYSQNLCIVIILLLLSALKKRKEESFLQVTNFLKFASLRKIMHSPLDYKDPHGCCVLLLSPTLQVSFFRGVIFDSERCLGMFYSRSVWGERSYPYLWLKLTDSCSFSFVTKNFTPYSAGQSSLNIELNNSKAKTAWIMTKEGSKSQERNRVEATVTQELNGRSALRLERRFQWHP